MEGKNPLSYINQEPITLFYSYAPEDNFLCQQLEKHLTMLREQGLFKDWHKHKTLAGQEWKQEIDEHLNTAAIILLLVSPDFMASAICNREMQRALDRQKNDQTLVIPILLRPFDLYNAPFEHLQYLPRNSLPVTQWSSIDNAFAEISSELRRTIEEEILSIPLSLSKNFRRIWNIPYHRNPLFTGREDLLKVINQQMQIKQSLMLTQPKAISGLGGVGKTQLAIEYAYQYKDDYQTILWTLADSSESLTSGFIGIATLLKLPERNEREQKIVVDAVKRWFQYTAHWLLILDNADDLTIIPKFLPTVHSGHILITTRAQTMGRLATRIEVDSMDMETGALLLLKRAGLLLPDTSITQVIKTNYLLAEQICQEMGGLPLALDQAGAYIENSRCGLAEYLHLFRTRRVTLLKERGGIIQDHPEPVATTWSLSFTKMEQENAASVDLLNVCALLHPDAVPEEIFSEGGKHLGPTLTECMSDPYTWNKALSTVGNYSLLQRNYNEHNLSLHRLVQAMLQEIMPKKVREQWVKRIIIALDAVFPESSFYTWEKCERLIPHVLACASHLPPKRSWRKKDFPQASLFLKSAVYLSDRAKYVEAELLFHRALSIWEQVLGSDHIQVASPLNGLANLYQEQGKNAEAEALYQRVIGIQKQALEPDHLLIAGSLASLANIYLEQRKYVEAEGLYMQALHIQEQSINPNDLQLAYALNGLADLYQEQGKKSEAEVLYQRVISIREKALSFEHTEVSYSLINLANLYQGQGRYVEAEPLYQRALHIWRQVPGLGHPQLAYTAIGLANLYRKLRRYADAESLYQQSLHILEQTLGPEHIWVAIPLNELAKLYQKQGKNVEAEALYQRAIAIQERSLESGNLGEAHSIINLADLYEKQNKDIEAELLYLRALSIREQVLGYNHSSVASPIRGLATLYKKKGKYAEAEVFYQRALHIWEHVLEPDDLQIAPLLNDLADIYQTQNKYAEAEVFYQRALHIWEHVLEPDDLQIASPLYGLAILYQEQGRDAQTETFYQRALQIWEHTLGSEHPQIAHVLNALADFYQEQSKYDEAEVLYERAIRIWEHELGSEDLQVASPLYQLANLYQKQGKYDEADLLYQRISRIRSQNSGS